MKRKMTNKKALNFITLAAIASQAFAWPAYAQTVTPNYTDPNIPRTEAVREAPLPSSGLMAYFFSDEHFKDLELMAPMRNGGSEFDQKEAQAFITKDRIKSIRWTGRIIPSEDGEYTLSTDKEDALMQINNSGDIAKELTVNMRKGQEYTIRIEIKDSGLSSIETLSAPALYWELNGNKAVIPEENLFLRDYSNIDENDPFIPNNNFFDRKLRTARSVNSGWEDEDLDTDNDNIPDAYEQNGYTIKDLIAVKWEDSLAEIGRAHV